MAQPKPDRAQSTHYFKTTVSRVLDTRMGVGAAGVTLRRWFAPADMARTDLFDAQDGMLFLRISLPAGADVSAAMDIIWEIPGSPFDLVRSTHTLTPGTVERFEAWSGPTPARVGYELRVSSPSPVIARFEMDLCAKRLGGNFVRGMWLRDRAAAVPSTEQVAPFDPNMEAAGPPRTKAAASCGRRNMRRGSTAPQGPGGPPMRGLPGRAELPEPPREIPRMEEASDSAGSSSGDAWLCEPDERALDWWAAIIRSGGSVADGQDGLVPDPEMVETVRRLGAHVSKSSVAVRWESLQTEFPARYAQALGKEALTLGDLATSVGRCVGFTELWDQVTTLDEKQGSIERRRFSSSGLTQILNSGTKDEYETRDIGALIDSADDETDTQWNWAVTTPWFHQERAWFAASLLNLVFATRGQFRDVIRTKKKKGKNKIFKERAMDRLSLAHVPNWRLSLGNARGYLSAEQGPCAMGGVDALSNGAYDVGSFHLGSLGWEGGFTKCAWKGDAALRAGTAGLTTSHGRGVVIFLAGRDIDTSQGPAEKIDLKGWWVAPSIRPAAELYGLARLATAMVATYADRLSPEDTKELLHLATEAYRAHIGLLTRCTELLVHEMFHLVTHYRDADHFSSMDHCVTGCGQEKMSASWYMRVGRRYGLPVVRREARHPTEVRYRSPEGDALTISGGSGCLKVDRLDRKVGSNWTIKAFGTPESSVSFHPSTIRLDEGHFEQRRDKILLRARGKKTREKCKLSKLESKRQCADGQAKSGRASRLREKERRVCKKIRRVEHRADKKIYRLRIRSVDNAAGRKFVRKCWMPWKRPGKRPAPCGLKRMLKAEIRDSTRRDESCLATCEGEKRPWSKKEL